MSWERFTRQGVTFEGHAIEVCEDCVFADAYGAREEGGRWFAGESDSPTDCEPWSRIDDACERSTGCACDECLAAHDAGEDGPHAEGLGFSWSACDACGSRLGGTRYQAYYWTKEEVTA